MSDAQRKSRGVRARIELDETEAAFERMKAAATANWIATKPDETTKREECWRLIGVIDEVRKQLREIVDDGLMAEASEARSQG